MGLPDGPLARGSLRPHMTRVMRAIISHMQQPGRERRGQRGGQTIGAISFHMHT